MPRLDFSSSVRFIRCLDHFGQAVLWKECRWLEREVRTLFSTEESRLLEITRQFKRAVAHHELYRSGNPHQLLAINQVLHERFIVPYLARPVPPWKAALWFLQSLLRITLIPARKELLAAFSESERAVLSLKYRMGVLKKQPENWALISQLGQSALKWKQSYPIYSEAQKAALTPFDQRAIKHLSRYPEIAKSVSENPLASRNAFKFLLNHGVQVSLFVRYPESMEKLSREHLTSRAGGLHSIPNMPRLKDLDGKGLGVRFAFSGKCISVTSKEWVEVAPNLFDRADRVFKDFEDKNVRPGTYEMFADGIRLWDPQHYSLPRDALDWYRDLPLLDRMSFHEVAKLFDIEEGDAVWAYSATRQSEGWKVDGTHGFWSMYEPDGPGVYRVWAFGVFAEVWPEELFDQLKFIGDTVKAVVAYPDPNFAFYPHRQKAQVPVIFKPADTEKYASYQRRFLDLVKNEKLVFQWGGLNCAYPAERLIMGTPGSLIRTSSDLMEPPAHLAPFLKPYQWTPKVLQPLVRRMIVLTIGGRRELHGESLWTSPFVKSGEMYYPGKLHRRVLSGELKGSVHGGHNRDYEG